MDKLRSYLSKLKRIKINRMQLMVIIMSVLVAGLGTIGLVHAVSTADSDDNEMKTYRVYAGEPFVVPEVKGKHRICVSRNKEVAKVHSDGKVDAKSIGRSRVDIFGLTVHDRVMLDVAKRQNISADDSRIVTEYKGKAVKLNASTDSTEGNKLTYVSSDDKVAEVTEKGVVKPKKPGNAVITIKAEKSRSYHPAKKEIQVMVNKKAPNLQVEKAEISLSTMKKDEIIKVESDVDEKIKFESQDSKIIEVSEDGKITPKAEGQTKVKITTEETKYYGAAEVEVTVKVTKPTASDKAMAAAAWAIDIANDNSFAYGTGAAAHHTGCYFCGTNQRKKPSGYEKTYVCLTFVGAAYAHGAQDPDILSACKAGKMTCYSNDENFSKFSCWEKIGSCGELSIDDLLPGDVLVQWGRGDNGDGSHVCIYTGKQGGNYMLAEAAYEGWGADTIRHCSGAEKRLKQYGGNSNNYVMRYTR